MNILMSMLDLYTFNNHLSVIVVALPMIIAVLMLFIRSNKTSYILSIIVSLVNINISYKLLMHTINGKDILYHISNFAGPIGIDYKITPIASMILLLLSIIYAFTCVWGFTISKAKMSNVYLFYTLITIMYAGILGMITTNDAFNVFVFLEISSLSTYTLIALNNTLSAYKNAFYYLIIGSVAASFYILGVGLLYMITGTLNLDDLILRLSGNHSMIMYVGMAFMLSGLIIKSMLFPINQWAVGVYRHSLDTFTVFLSSAGAKVMIFVVVKVFLLTVGAGFPELVERICTFVLIPFACINILFGSFSAYFPKDMKTILVYSSIAYLGYIIALLGLNNAESIQAALITIVAHSLTKAMMFMAVAHLTYCFNTSKVHKFSGMGYALPITFITIIVGALSLSGFPGTVGFISKVYTISSLIQHSNWYLLFIFIISSILGILYSWNIITILYLKPSIHKSGANVIVNKSTLTMNTVLIIMVAINIALGLNPTWLINTTHKIAIYIVGA